MPPNTCEKECDKLLTARLDLRKLARNVRAIECKKKRLRHKRDNTHVKLTLNVEVLNNRRASRRRKRWHTTLPICWRAPESCA